MQMGFEPYLLLMHEQPALFRRLMEINEDFCIRWANAQLAAGATAICYFDPVASPDIVPRGMYRETGFRVASRVLAAIEGPTAVHFASGRSLPLIGDLFETEAKVVCPGTEEDLSAVRAACAGKMAVLGNLNGVEMRRWTPAETRAKVRSAISAAGTGGGFILAESHGEIPFQVPEEVLTAISGTVHTWGRYPLQGT
jgi:uroporphyrinogen decarboxylase